MNIKVENTLRTMEYKSLVEGITLLIVQQAGIALLLKNKDIFNEYMSIFIPICVLHIAFVWGTIFLESDIKLVMVIQTILNLGIGIQVLLNKQNPAVMIITYYITIALALGLVIIIIKVMNACSLKLLRTILYGLTTICWILLLVLGTTIHGTRAWIVFGNLSLQVTEIIKLLMILAFVSIFADKKISEKCKLIHALAFTTVNALLLLLISELGTLLIVGGVFFLFTFICTEKIRDFIRLFACLFFSGGMAVGLVLLLDYLYSKGICNKITGIAAAIIGKLQTRFDLWLRLDELDPYDKAYQPLQARLALNMSGLWGNNRGTVDIPAGDTDYIFVSLVYYLGIIIGIIVFVFFVYALIRGTYIYLRNPNAVESMIVCGFSYALFIQMLIAVAGTTNCLLMTGVGLPFLSRGFTNLLVSEVFVIYMLFAGRTTDIFDKGMVKEKERTLICRR